ncbi:hypothetical protein, partial [Neisseria sp. HMSC069H12]|uniref:hypothetical protein n=1 Tax=Neisseria sp. HMSC069H12 TaxID=1739376 RepID=UPI001AF02226
PPSGGCVLKQTQNLGYPIFPYPATFRRLCVETSFGHPIKNAHCPATFRRLCVETQNSGWPTQDNGPAAFRRLCVETTLEAAP